MKLNSKFDVWRNSSAEFRKVKSLYKFRPYHNWNHIEKCLGFFENRLNQYVTDELLFSVVYHDAIYDPTSKTNEEDSVSVAKLDLSGMGLNLNRIEDIILSTKHTYSNSFTEDSEIQCMLDVDLSILGSPKDEYDEYSKQIRNEYSYVDDAHFALGRIDFLQKMLSRKVIFNKLTELESAARNNLYEEIVRLSR